MLLPLIQPQINWQAYNLISEKELGFNILKVLQSNNIDNKTGQSLLCAFELADTGEIKTEYKTFKHLNYSFIGKAENEYTWSWLYNFFKVVRKKNAFIITGSLYDYQIAVINTDEQVKELTTQMYNYLCRAGLKKIWQEYKVTKDNDGNIRISRD